MIYKNTLFLVCLLGITQSIYADENLHEKLSNNLAVNGLVHVQSIGDTSLQNHRWAGTKYRDLRLEAYQLDVNTSMRYLNVQYMCHLEDIGDTSWLKQGSLCGTKGESRGLEGFAIRLRGIDAAHYSVKYQCRTQDGQTSKILADGEFCGTRGLRLALEGMRVWIVKR